MKYKILFSTFIILIGAFALFFFSFHTYEKVYLYYYNSEKDKDENGDIMCSRKGLDRVERKIPTSKTLISDTLHLLLQGKITQEEKQQGRSTEFPLSGFELVSSSLREGVLTLTFKDPENTTSGGSCRVGILWFQIEATAKQFSQVQTVQFIPEELFQP